MYLPLHTFLVKLPSVEQVEKIFKVVRFILWNCLELVLLMTAMTAIAGQALTDVPAFREWLHHQPLKAPAPPSAPPDSATPPAEAPEPQRQPERTLKPIPIVRVARQRRPMTLPAINRITAESVIDIDPPVPRDIARTEYAGPIMPLGPEVPKPRHNAAIRAITAPVRGVEAIARKIRTAFRDNTGSDVRLDGPATTVPGLVNRMNRAN